MRGPTAWVYAGLFAASGALFALDITEHRAAEAARQALTDAAAPALGAVSASVFTVRSWVGEARGLANLSREVDRLKAENDALQDWRRRAMELEARAERYEELLQIQPDAGTNLITARTIADARSPFTRSIIINAGEADGVKQGSAVIATRGLIGRVAAAGVHSARVLLVSDIESRIPVHVGSGRHRAILAGTNESEPTLMHLPPGANARQGDQVVTSGEGGLFPPGLAIGRVDIDDNGSVSVRLGEDPASIDFVRVYNTEFLVDVAAGAPPLPGALAEAAEIPEVAEAPDATASAPKTAAGDAGAPVN